MTTIARITAAHEDQTRHERFLERIQLPTGMLQAETAATLRLLAGEATLLHHLVDSRQRGLGFLTMEAKQARAEQHADDVAARAELVDICARLGIDVPNGHGATDAPGNVTAMSVDDQVGRRLRSLNAALRKHLRTWPADRRLLAADAGTAATVEQTAVLVALIDQVRPLARVLEVIEELVLDVDVIVEGTDRSRLPGATCPFCNLDTLVIEWRTWTIRCDKPLGAAQHEACVCDDGYCECHRNPVAFRHTWLMSAGIGRGSWVWLGQRSGVGAQVSKHIYAANADVQSRKRRLARLSKKIATAQARPDVDAAIRQRLDQAQRARHAGPADQVVGRPATDAERCVETDLPADFCRCPACTHLDQRPTDARKAPTS
ncbi:hypothetical protein [Nocardioides marmoraquaticus]